MGRAASAVVDTRSVATEGAASSIDGNRDGSNSCKSVGQVVLTSWLGIVESADGCNNSSSVELAVSLSGGVTVRGLRLITAGILGIRSCRTVRSSRHIAARTSWGDFLWPSSMHL